VQIKEQVYGNINVTTGGLAMMWKRQLDHVKALLWHKTLVCIGLHVDGLLTDEQKQNCACAWISGWEQMTVISHIPYSPNLAPCDFSFPETQAGTEDEKIWCHHDSRATALSNRNSEQDSIIKK
jgi:hypothetical protein